MGRTAMKWPKREGLALGGALVFLLLTAPLFAQDTPVGPAGAEVATQDTPAAATNSDALRNAAQNPIASLISVPIQDNFNLIIKLRFPRIYRGRGSGEEAVAQAGPKLKL